MIDKHVLDQLEGILAHLSTKVTVINKDRPDHDPAVDDMTDGVVQPLGEKLCLPLKQPAMVLCCDRNAPQGSDVLALAAALVQSLCTTRAKIETSYDVYRRVLNGDVKGAELEALCHEHGIPRDMKRAVILFHVIETGGQRAYDLLRDMTPLQERDVLIDMDRHTVALIKDTAGGDEIEELIQFSEALQETLMSETARQMTAGIGSECRKVEELYTSCTEAKKAIEIGRVFREEETTFAYSRLLLERFLSDLPPALVAEYAGQHFNRRTQRLFNDEILYTIDMFFKKDLNLSDTARQLYIHRNTLVYRLDKVQRQTGLDLRRFEDAATFKLLMEMSKCGEKNKGK